MLLAMSRRRYILNLVAGGSLFLCLIIVTLPRDAEPSYQGRTLSEWIGVLNPLNATRDGPSNVNQDPNQRKLAAEVIRHIGTNGIPFLIDWNQHGGRSWKMKLNE